MPVTMAMLESGFQTKSNFNREFRRVTSLSPAAWRERSRSETFAVVARVGAEDA
jgi:AraC-like DNA-binding protein